MSAPDGEVDDRVHVVGIGAAAGAEEAPPNLLERLLSLLRENLHFDFSGYKTRVLLRRIHRRELATGSADLAAYLDLVARDPEEQERLTHDILIPVTAFFRDGEAFEALRQVIDEICTSKQPGGEIRAWVAGCASGEEAYSIAMLFAESLGERLPQSRVQIFATDVDAHSLDIARRGIYPVAAMSEVAPSLLERYCRLLDHGYAMGKTLRDMVVFTRHNLVSDPPFLHMDLVACRNVLIYFDKPLQGRVLRAFHFGLGARGTLFLGRSEGIAQAASLFIQSEPGGRLFRKASEPEPVAARRQDPKLEHLLSVLAGHFTLTAALCDLEGNILHTVGPVDRYLKFPKGATHASIGEVIPPLRGELPSLIQRCKRQGRPQRGELCMLGQDGVRIHVAPITAAGTEALLVLFLPEDGVEPGCDERPDELLAARKHALTLAREMAAASEEAQVANEELRATNEELEAANTELISLNEELNIRTTDYSSLSTEYAHLYDALDFPILLFDRAMQLMRFNAPAGRRFNLRPSALRQHVARSPIANRIGELETLLARVLVHGVREEMLTIQDQRTLRLAVSPGFDKAGEVVSLVVTLIDVSDITRVQAELKESEQRLAALMRKTTVSFAMKDPSGAYQFANQRFLNLFGLDEQTYSGKTDFHLLAPEQASALRSMDMEALRRQSAVTGEHQVRLNGSQHHLRSVHQAIRDEDGTLTAFITEVEDITLAKHAEEQLRITARVFEQAGEAILVTDPAGIIQSVNPAFTRITGYAPEEALARSVNLLNSGRHGNDFYAAMWRALDATGFWQGEIWNRRKNGEVFPEWLTINRVDDDDCTPLHFVAVFSDITSIKESQHKAEYLATHDTLTGLPNRALFQDHLRHAQAQARRDNTRFALLFIDLDNFKTINDTRGHNVGDALLQQAANRLHEVVRDVDTVARLGGDEFTAILREASDEIANQVGQRILDVLSAPYEIDAHALFVTASIGIAFYPDDGSDSTMLIKAADSAMYRAKEEGRQRIEFFKPELHVRLLKRAKLESHLREALLQERLRLVYQPKFGLGQGRPLMGAEALLRWHDPELGEVSPAEFIPVAEASPLILEIGMAVSHLLVQQIAAWQALGLKLPPVAVNLSPRCIREAGYAECFLELLRSHQVPPELLIAEVTEGALLENSPQVNHNLASLHRAGLGISIDDFGTGYSSLGYLKRLPLTELKIDKSFVDGLGQDKEDEAIARAVLGLAQALELKTVAEGVETELQLAWLGKHGCEGVQGFLLSRPLEAAAYQELIARNPSHG